MKCSARGFAISLFRTVAAVLIVTALSGCGKQESGSWRDQVASCPSAPPDQKDSFMAPVGGGPIQLLIDNTFTADQQAGIHQMVVQWNQLGQTLRGADFFTEVKADVPAILKSGNFQNCDIDVGTGAGGLYLVNITDEQHWEDIGFSTQIPGATVRCYVNDYLDKQVSMIRPDLVDSTQFTSVILHELGHTLGLDHSCDAKGGTSSFLSCSDVKPDTPYYDAVMYPTLQTGTSSHSVLQVKDKLQSNDTARASCLY